MERKEVVLNEVPVQHVAAEVVFQGEKITLPVGMEVPTAITTLQQFMEAQEALVTVVDTFGVFPWDGAFALKRCLEKRFGFVEFRGAEISQEVGPNERANVPWGNFTIANLAKFSCGTQMVEGRFTFKIQATCKRKAEQIIRTVFKDVHDYLRSGGSIYQGKAIKLRLQYDDGSDMEMPEPKFIDTSAIDVSKLVFNEDVENALEVNLFTPVRRVKELQANGISVKRAVLLAGTYGTGKTMAASAASKIAVQNGVTYVYIKRASELAAAINFVKMYSTPAAVIFCEDIDRSFEGRDRDTHMDEMLNTIDGLDTKNTNVLIVLTTNDVESIHPAMLRPGRLDAVINFTAPDAPTAERILRQYCGDQLAESEDISRAGKLLAGQIPAVLAECVKRAKLAQLSLNAPGEKIDRLTGQALFLAAQSMAGQIKLLQDQIDRDKPKVVPQLDQALHAVVTDAMQNGGGKAVFEAFQRGGK